MEAVVLPLTYFGNLSYFKLLFKYKQIWIDDQEPYLKQTYRNRTQILAANGPLDLSVPIQSTKGFNMPMDQIKISYDDTWQIKHWRSIVSAYKSAPFFEEYEEEIKSLILQEIEHLKDLNLSILSKLLDLLSFSHSIIIASEEKIPANTPSFKGFFKPSKMPESHSDFSPYLQVFNYKFGFSPNLSILDLIFNEGPYSSAYLLNSIANKN